jgi:hypothetical protein
MGHTSNGLHRISHLPRIVSRTPKWVKWAQETSKSSQISRQVCNPGPAICRFHLFLFHVLPRIYYTIFLHPDVCTRPSWGLTRICFVHVAHYAGNMMTWIACAFISGLLSLCWIRIETEKSFIAFSALWGRQDSSFLQFEQTAHRDIVYRLLLCRACHTTRFLLPQYLSRPLAPGHSTRHVLGRFLHRNLDWGADCRSAAYDV